jgi:hypothetical protein
MSNPPRIKPVLLNIMGDREWTLKELCAATDFTFDGINSVLRGMHGEAYICGWQPQWRATPCAIWKLGKGEHVPRPAAKYAKKTGYNPTAIDLARLQQGYVQGPRIWGI